MIRKYQFKSWSIGIISVTLKKCLQTNLYWKEVCLDNFSQHILVHSRFIFKYKSTFYLLLTNQHCARDLSTFNEYQYW